MRKKYTLLEDLHELSQTKVLVRQIMALRDIPRWGVKVGDKGGFIESHRNLDQNGDCWIGPGAMAIENSRICCNALLKHQDGKAPVVRDNAFIGGNAILMGSCLVEDNACVHGPALLKHCRISDDGFVSGPIHAEGVIVKDNAVIDIDLDSYTEPLRLLPMTVFANDAVICSLEDFVHGVIPLDTVSNTAYITAYRPETNEISDSPMIWVLETSKIHKGPLGPFMFRDLLDRKPLGLSYEDEDAWVQKWAALEQLCSLKLGPYSLCS